MTTITKLKWVGILIMLIGILYNNELLKLGLLKYASLCGAIFLLVVCMVEFNVKRKKNDKE